MNDVFLTKPDKKYENSFKSYALAYEEIKDEHYFRKYKKALENFDSYLNDLQLYSMGMDIPRGHVPTSAFWLINKEEVVGVVRVRHEDVDCAGHIGYDISPNFRHRGYGHEILKLALEKALELGLMEVILTCNIDNNASKKIIEKNKGKLLGTCFDEEENEYLYRYSISLTDN